ncbi:MAG TPA: EamA family transporter [Verrucomicrobiae bacterium]|nr:EamA family transporter [Verrucomicrobiae bacterium]
MSAEVSANRPCEEVSIAHKNAQVRQGLVLGGAAVVFWSFGSSLVYLGAREAGTWRLIAIASLCSGTLQLVWRRLCNGELRSAIFLPWRLWAVPMACFVTYGLVWPTALAGATADQVGGVNLINYLWPVLTLLFSVACVPGVKFTGRLAIAMSLAAAGLICANAAQLHTFLNPPGSSHAPRAPYALALIAAITWAGYSAFLARWKDWSRNYVTSPMGFITLGIVGCVVLALRTNGPAREISPLGLGCTLLYGLGPLGAGYLMWELALSRAKVQSLSVLAAATPVLSTIILCVFLKRTPGLDLLFAALLVSAGVILSIKE